ncbi:MAG: DUF4347 domain-containing protein [Alphaproteobacteria bacterium]|nr:DUF4347 domain-containing protein [Alphaproteobacteria bacterium]
MKCQQHDNANIECDLPQVDLPTPEFQQGRGNGFALEQLREHEGVAQGDLEPVDVVAIDDDGSWAAYFAIKFNPASVNAAGGLRSMINNVLAQADGRPIGTLSIFAHARPGQLYVGGDQLNGADLTDELPQLQRLTPHFHETGRVEIHGCNFGADEAGDRAVYVLSEVWGVPVTAGVHAQNGAPGFEGGTVTWGQDEEGYTLREEDPAWSDGLMGGVESFLDAKDAARREGLETLEDIQRWLFEE